MQKHENQKRHYTEEFKAEVVALCEKGDRSCRQIAEDLGVKYQTICTWVQRAKKQKATSNGLAPSEKEELIRLRKDNARLRMEREILKSRGLLRERESVRYPFIDAEKATYPVTVLCSALEVSRSSYYAWRSRPVSERQRSDEALSSRIVEIHSKSRRTYGSPRICAELRSEGMTISRKRVARLMRLKGVVAKRKRRFVPKTTDSNHALPVAPNLLDRTFTQTAPNQAWVGDITYIRTGEGWLYLATLLDLYSRKVVGWAMSNTIDRHLVLDALKMAVVNRRPGPGLLHHTDRGSQYASGDYRKALEKHGMTVSMSRKGNYWDNAVAESFFSTLKTELSGVFETRAEARTGIFEYIEVFYNRQRRHSSIGYLSPVEFEKRIAG